MEAKLSDFGSAKLAMEAKTTGSGAYVSAPGIWRYNIESVKTVKGGVYSYGVLLCEVTMGQFPLEERLPSMIEVIRDRWVFMHSLITACLQEHPDNRLTMSHVLTEHIGHSSIYTLCMHVFMIVPSPDSPLWSQVLG